MAKFVLTAELAVRNQNLRPVISQLQKQLSSVKANVTLKLDPSTKGKLDNINKALAVTEQRLKSAAGAAVVLNQQISQLNKTLGGNLKQLGQITKTAQANQKAMTATAKATNQAASGMTRLGQQSAFAIKRIAAFSVATSSVIALTTAMKAGIQEAILFQHGLVRVSQITGTSVKNLGNLTAEITRLATTLGVSSQELLAVSDTLAQAGLSAGEVKVALEALAKTKLAPTFGKIEDTVEGVIASMRQFKIGVENLESTLGSFNSVAAAFAVESQDIVTAVRRSGAAFQAAGGSLEEFIALFTSVRQTTRESAETIATGFRTIFTRIQRPKTLNFLRDLGVELLDLKGRFVGPYEAVRRLSDALSDIPGNDPRFAQIIEELGGFRQVSKVIPLIQQFATAEKALAVAQRGRGSLTRDAVTAQQSLLVQLTKLRERFFELFRTIGDNTAIKGFLGLTLKIADNLITVGQSLTPLVPLFTAIGAIKLSSGLRQFSTGFLGKANSGTQSASSTNNKLNTVQASAATANANQSGAISANTTALNNLASQINNLSSVLKASIAATTKTVIGPGGIARQVPRKFARGGLVPGFGNRDTVPALLTPGEYVLPTSAVQAYGAGNIAALHKGGQVQKFALGGKVGMASLRTAAGETFKPTQPQEVSLEGIPLSGTIRKQYNIGKDNRYKYNLVSGVLDGAFADTFDNDLEQGLQNIVRGLSSKYLSKIPGYHYQQQDLSKFGFDAMSGQIFEASIAAVGPPFEKTDNSQGFDFPSGLQHTAQSLFGNAELANAVTDAKRSYSIDSIKSIRGKVYNYIEKENLASLSPQQLKVLNTNNAKKKVQKKAEGGNITGVGTDTVPALLTPGEYVLDKSTAQRVGYNNLDAMRVQKYAKGGLVRKYASGGKVATGSGGADLSKLTPLLFVLPQVTSMFGGLSEEISTAITQFTVIASIAGATGKSLGGFKENTEKVNKIQSKISSSTNRSFARLKTRYEDYKANPTPDTLGAFTRQAQRTKRNANKRTPLRQAQLRQAKLGRLAEGAGGIGAGLGIVASVVGESKFSKPAFANIQAGKGTQKDVTNAGYGGLLGGAGSGAAMGAAVGSFLGPLGTLGGAVIGGAIGGITGFTNATKEATDQMKSIAIGQQFERLDKTLERINKGTTLSGFDRVTVGNQIDTLQGNVLNASSKDKPEILAKAQGQLPGIQGFADKLASSSKSIEQFKSASGGLGKKLIETISLLANVPIVEVEEQFKKTIEAQNKASTLQDKINAALATTYQDAQYVNNVVKAFNDSTSALQKFTNKANIIANDFQNLQFDSDMSDIISQGLEANPADLTKALTQLLGESGNGLANRLGQSASAAQNLPNVLRKALEAGPLSDTGGDKTPLAGFAAAVEDGIADFPKELKASIQLKLDEFLADDSGDSKFIDEIRSNAEKFAKDLTEGTALYLESLNSAAEIAKNNANALIGMLQQRNAIEQKVTDLSINAATSRFKANRQAGLIGTDKFNSDLSSKDARSLVNINQNRRLRKGGLNGGESADALADAISSKRAKLLNLQNQRNNVNPVSKEFETLSRSIAGTENELQHLLSALNDQATSTEVLTALQNELSTAENKRKSQLSAATNLAFGGREGRKEFAKSAQNARTIANNPNAIGNAEQEGSALQFLDQVIEMGAGDKKLAALGGKSAKEVKENRLSAFIGKEDAKLLVNSTKEEITIQRAIVDQQKAMVTAQERLSNLEQQKLDMLDVTLNSGFESLRNTFEASMAEAQARRSESETKSRQEIADKSLSVVQKKEDLNKRLKAVGIEGDAATGVNAERVAQNADVFTTLDKQKEIRDKLRNLRTTKERVTLDPTSDQGSQIQSVLSNKFSGLIDQTTLQAEIDKIKTEVENFKEVRVDRTLAQARGGVKATRAATDEEKNALLNKRVQELVTRTIDNNSKFSEQTLKEGLRSQGFTDTQITQILELDPQSKALLFKLSKEVGNVDLAEARRVNTQAQDSVAKSSAQSDIDRQKADASKKAAEVSVKSAEQTAFDNKTQREQQKQSANTDAIAGFTGIANKILSDIYGAITNLEKTTVQASETKVTIPDNDTEKDVKQKAPEVTVNIPKTEPIKFVLPKFQMPDIIGTLKPFFENIVQTITELKTTGEVDIPTVPTSEPPPEAPPADGPHAPKKPNDPSGKTTRSGKPISNAQAAQIEEANRNREENLRKIEEMRRQDAWKKQNDARERQGLDPLPPLEPLGGNMFAIPPEEPNAPIPSEESKRTTRSGKPMSADLAAKVDKANADRKNKLAGLATARADYAEKLKNQKPDYTFEKEAMYGTDSDKELHSKVLRQVNAEVFGPEEDKKRGEDASKRLGLEGWQAGATLGPNKLFGLEQNVSEAKEVKPVLDDQGNPILNKNSFGTHVPVFEARRNLNTGQYETTEEKRAREQQTKRHKEILAEVDKKYSTSHIPVKTPEEVKASAEKAGQDFMDRMEEEGRKAEEERQQKEKEKEKSIRASGLYGGYASAAEEHNARIMRANARPGASGNIPLVSTDPNQILEQNRADLASGKFTKQGLGLTQIPAGDYGNIPQSDRFFPQVPNKIGADPTLGSAHFGLHKPITTSLRDDPTFRTSSTSIADRASDIRNELEANGMITQTSERKWDKWTNPLASPKTSTAINYGLNQPSSTLKPIGGPTGVSPLFRRTIRDDAPTVVPHGSLASDAESGLKYTGIETKPLDPNRTAEGGLRYNPMGRPQSTPDFAYPSKPNQMVRVGIPEPAIRPGFAPSSDVMAGGPGSDSIMGGINNAGKVIANGFSDGAKQLGSVFGDLAKILPTSIELAGKFEPIQVNITGAEALKGLESILGPAIMAQVSKQLSKVIPGLETLLGPGPQIASTTKGQKKGTV